MHLVPANNIQPDPAPAEQVQLYLRKYFGNHICVDIPDCNVAQNGQVDDIQWESMPVDISQPLRKPYICQLMNRACEAANVPRKPSDRKYYLPDAELQGLLTPEFLDGRREVTVFTIGRAVTPV